MNKPAPVSVKNTTAALIMSAPRVYYAMAQDGLFLRAVARTHPRFGTPANAIFIQGLVASVLVSLGSFQQIISYFIFVAVVFLTLTGAGLFIVRTRDQGTAPSFLTPAYPIPLAGFLILMPLLLALLALHSPREALLGSVVVLAGLPPLGAFRLKSSMNQTLNP